MANNILEIDSDIKSKIYNLRGVQVILDEDLANFYQVKTKRLNEQVKRNIKRFPKEFMFQLTNLEFKSLRSQIATLKKGRGEHRKFNSFAFTEQGVAMLSGLLKSDIAIKVSIQIIKQFIAMHKFISLNAQLFFRLDMIETKQIEYQLESDNKFEKIFKTIEDKSIIPNKGIFFDGQIYDAYKFVSDLIKSAKHSIILIDNYIDDDTLTILSKKKKNVKIKLLIKNISKQLQLDVNKFNEQYGLIEIKTFNFSHDRFLIIDKKEVYHIGASLKDLGTKWFAFSKFNQSVIEVLSKIK